ncbi:hypothetical protein HAX54_046061, partial [Datura stramonium]|nr:hypothetical protein [Datura stramonium]
MLYWVVNVFPLHHKDRYVKAIGTIDITKSKDESYPREKSYVNVPMTIDATLEQFFIHVERKTIIRLDKLESWVIELERSILDVDVRKLNEELAKIDLVRKRYLMDFYSQSTSSTEVGSSSHALEVK